MPSLDGLRVVLSQIHGYGVVTTRPFAEGEVVSFGDGVMYPTKTTTSTTPTRSCSIEAELGKQFLWDLVDQTRWFNHSCDPKARSQSRVDDATADHPAVDRAPRDRWRRDHVRLRVRRGGRRAVRCGAASCRGSSSIPIRQLAKLPPHLQALLRRPA